MTLSSSNILLTYHIGWRGYEKNDMLIQRSIKQLRQILHRLYTNRIFTDHWHGPVCGTELHDTVIRSQSFWLEFSVRYKDRIPRTTLKYEAACIFITAHDLQ